MSYFTHRLVAGVLTTGALLPFAAADVHGQQIVALPVADRILSGAPADVFTVGVADGETWEMFSRIRGLEFDAKGNLHVLDAGNHRVVVFDRTGRFLRQFGKRGQGPGEFQNPSYITITAQGEVVINDPSNRALVIFNANGEFLRQVSLAEVADHPSRIHAASDGRILSLSAGLESPEGRFARLYVLPARTGAAHTEIARAPLPEMLEMRMRGNDAGISGFRRTPVYSPDVYFAVTSDGAAVLQTDAPYALKVHDNRGRHVRTLTRALPQLRVTKELQDAFLQSWSRSRVELGASAALPYDPPFAEVMSQVTGLRADRAGRVWVRRRAVNGDEDGLIDIVTPAGKYLGTLRGQSLPAAFGPDGLMAYISPDELGIERVVVRRQPAAWQ